MIDVLRAAFFDELEKISACMPKEKDSGFSIQDVLANRALQHGPASVGRGTFQRVMGQAAYDPVSKAKHMLATGATPKASPAALSGVQVPGMTGFKPLTPVQRQAGTVA